MTVVQPKTWLHADTLRVTPNGADGSLWIECDGIRPKSFVGRTVYVRIPAELIDALLLEVRDAARRVRMISDAGTS